MADSLVDTLITTLTVPFAAGFVVQRGLEILDPFTSKVLGNPITKKAVLGVVSLGLGWAMAAAIPIQIFHQLLTQGVATALPKWVDSLLSGVFISAGTEGFNSLMKFANYKKEASKADAASKLNAAGDDAVKKVNPQQ
jgi:hypothetical protein